MSDEERWAVYLDFNHTNDRIRIVYTIPLGGTIGSREQARIHLGQMQFGDVASDYWEVDELELPHGYKFQTYYVARYFDGDEK